MAISNAIPELWRAALLQGFQSEAIWAGLASDFSGDLPTGDILHLNEVLGTITIRDYSSGTDLAGAEEPDDLDHTITMDQKKYFNIAIDDIERFQTRAAAFEEFGRQAARQISNTFDEYVYSVYNSGWVDSGGHQNRFKPSSIDLGTKAGRTALVATALDVVKRMNAAKWPREGRWCVITTDVEDALVQYLLFDDVVKGSGALADRAVVQGAIGNLLGCNVITDSNLTVANATNNALMAFGYAGWGGYVLQIRKVEAYRPERSFKDALKGLWVYGASRLPRNTNEHRKYVITYD